MSGISDNSYIKSDPSGREFKLIPGKGPVKADPRREKISKIIIQSSSSSSPSSLESSSPAVEQSKLSKQRVKADASAGGKLADALSKYHKGLVKSDEVIRLLELYKKQGF